MEKEKMMECAMQIIAYAGSAFDYFNRAIETAEKVSWKRQDSI